MARVHDGRHESDSRRGGDEASQGQGAENAVHSEGATSVPLWDPPDRLRNDVHGLPSPVGGDGGSVLRARIRSKLHLAANLILAALVTSMLYTALTVERVVFVTVEVPVLIDLQEELHHQLQHEIHRARWLRSLV